MRIPKITTTVAFLTLLGCPAHGGAVVDEKADRPNILLVLVDDLGCRDLAGEGHERHRTPALDALRAGSVRFTNAATNAPNCAPSRAALATGRHIKTVIIELRRSGQANKTLRSGGIFMRFEMKLVMVQDISWSGSDGDDICEETVILQFGAIEVTYTPQTKEGKDGTKQQARWSRVKNNNSLDV